MYNNFSYIPCTYHVIPGVAYHYREVFWGNFFVLMTGLVWIMYQNQNLKQILPNSIKNVIIIYKFVPDLIPSETVVDLY